jgi:hypothetical protein
LPTAPRYEITLLFCAIERQTLFPACRSGSLNRPYLRLAALGATLIFAAGAIAWSRYALLAFGLALIAPPASAVESSAAVQPPAGKVAAESVLVAEAIPDSLRRLIADIDARLTPVREWRRTAEAALRADSATPRADSVFIRMRATLDHTVFLATRPFHDHDFQIMIWPEGAVADYHRRLGKLPGQRPVPAEIALSDSVRKYLMQEGIWINHGEGTAYFNPSDRALLAWLGRFLTPQIHAFLQFEIWQQEVPLADDASLMVTVDELAQRLLAAEKLLNEFPDSPARPLTTYTWHQYLAAYLGGLPNSPAFHWRTRAMNPDFRKSHDQFLGLHGSTAAGRVLAEYAALLQRSGYRRTAQVDAFLQARWNELHPLHPH